MAGINFNSNSFQLRTTSLKKANVAPEAQKKEEEVKAGSEEKKPVIKTKIQNSSLNLLGNYNMVSVNTTAKKATLSAGGKAGVVNNDNQGDKKAENDVNGQELDYNEYMKRRNNGTLKPNDYTIVLAPKPGTINEKWYVVMYGERISETGMRKHKGFDNLDDAKEWGDKL